MYRKLIVFIQALAAVGILVIAVITWFGQSTNELRTEMREEFRSFRVEMRSFRAEMREGFRSFRAEMREEHTAIREEMHDMNKRLGRVEGEIRTLSQGRE